MFTAPEIVQIVRRFEVDHPNTLLPLARAIKAVSEATGIPEMTVRTHIRRLLDEGELVELREEPDVHAVLLPGPDEVYLHLKPSPPKPGALQVTIVEAESGSGGRRRHMVATRDRVRELKVHRHAAKRRRKLTESPEERQVAHQRDPELGDLVEQLADVLGDGSRSAMWPSGNRGVAVTIEFRPGDSETARRFLRGGLSALSN
ncbi:hypothetical protein [Kitasatospora purpeofusca]|uniref:hypothetical protein n=1 Tax=Kitasatospora purpeofusca TaxID=67352 RepID=UPI0035D81DCC